MGSGDVAWGCFGLGLCDFGWEFDHLAWLLVILDWTSIVERGLLRLGLGSYFGIGAGGFGWDAGAPAWVLGMLVGVLITRHGLL